MGVTGLVVDHPVGRPQPEEQRVGVGPRPRPVEGEGRPAAGVVGVVGRGAGGGLVEAWSLERAASNAMYHWIYSLRQFCLNGFVQCWPQEWQVLFLVPDLRCA